MRYYFAFLFCWFLGFAFGQGNLDWKVISTDTSGYQEHLSFLNKIDGQDFLKSSDDFNFRFEQTNQLIELTRNDNQLSGRVVNYATRSTIYSEDNSKLIFKEIELSADQLTALFDLVSHPNIRNLRTNKDDYGWGRGFDGLPYHFEFQDSSGYSREVCSHPNSFRNLTQDLLLLDALDYIKSIVDLRSLFKQFIAGLPNGYSYSYYCPYRMCVESKLANIRSSLGYLGSTRLPIGAQFGISIDSLSSKTLNLNIYGHIRGDFNGSYDNSLKIRKYGVSYGKNKHRVLNLEYGFRRRVYSFSDLESRVNTHHFYNSSWLRKLQTGYKIGAIYQTEETGTWGLRLGLSKRIAKLNLGFYANANVFKNEANLDIRVARGVLIDDKMKIVIGLGYEKFQSYHDAMLYVLFNLR